MSAIDVWAPLGEAGSAQAVDALSLVGFNTTPPRTPHVHRCDLEVGRHRLALSWREQRTLVASLASTEPAADRVIASGRNVAGDGTDSIVWGHVLMPVDVEGSRIEVDRARSGRDRWCWQVRGPQGRGWTWRPGGRLLADRMELTPQDAAHPTVVHTLRPVPGRPGSGGEPPVVGWTEHASLAEVVLAVMWVLDRSYQGLLPKAQRVARLDFLLA